MLQFQRGKPWMVKSHIQQSKIIDSKQHLEAIIEECVMDDKRSSDPQMPIVVFSVGQSSKASDLSCPELLWCLSVQGTPSQSLPVGTLVLVLHVSLPLSCLFREALFRSRVVITLMSLLYLTCHLAPYRGRFSILSNTDFWDR